MGTGFQPVEAYRELSMRIRRCLYDLLNQFKLWYLFVILMSSLPFCLVQQWTRIKGTKMHVFFYTCIVYFYVTDTVWSCRVPESLGKADNECIWSSLNGHLTCKSQKLSRDYWHIALRLLVTNIILSWPPELLTKRAFQKCRKRLQGNVCKRACFHLFIMISLGMEELMGICPPTFRVHSLWKARCVLWRLVHALLE